MTPDGLPLLSRAAWPEDAYDRRALPERVLQFGTGMLLRAIAAAAVDAANRSGELGGRIVVVQSTPDGRAPALNAQDGLFTLLERGLSGGKPVVRDTLVGSISRALVADSAWDAVRAAAATPDLRVVVSNVTEAGFRLDDFEPEPAPGAPTAPGSFPAKLTDLLYTRFTRLPHGPPLLVIPTELVPRNGPLLAGMVARLAAKFGEAETFQAWIGTHVRFCASLVDRITTGLPGASIRDGIESRLGYRDGLLTLTEPYWLWAVEGDPAELREALAIDAASPQSVIFAPDIGFYRERKLRLLNGAHTALAPLALLAGVPTVLEAVQQPRLGSFLRATLFEELIPATDLPAGEALGFARSVIDRFENPWLEHEWQTIATNHLAKFRLRVVPSLLGFYARRGELPPGITLSLAASLRFARPVELLSAGEGRGWWRGEGYRIVDVELTRFSRHWHAAAPGTAPEAALPAAALSRLAASALADAELWGLDLTRLPGLRDGVARALVQLELGGVDEALHAASRATMGR